MAKRRYTESLKTVTCVQCGVVHPAFRPSTKHLCKSCRNAKQRIEHRRSYRLKGKAGVGAVLREIKLEHFQRYGGVLRSGPNPDACFFCGGKALYRWRDVGSCRDHRNEVANMGIREGMVRDRSMAAKYGWKR